ncbi:hypothetical protein A2971_03955 [Candidatus Gottesmanbacteria bacterium RIFCSPLOWO2_01_FULL_46_21]|uniref:Uncharacterized protein n=1 Tax=Candidatus Gottesmanbacteria bacterium RIFCSPLOWO2_01_FULL_46_21 TaxID=1798393 RepID=A0A1F6AXJ8_9BACT|nr:MAG: hypothetical protein A2971_03955 [Candidatus Gottesmanbacteria bacterium RIFCSPLOWO2_01_FULL_46_21]
MIAHGDDEGKLKGDIDTVRGLVVPLMGWSVKKVHSYVLELQKQGLIYYWQENNEWFIEFVKWTDYQYIQKDRFKRSTLPKYNKDSVSNLDTDRIQADNTSSPQAKLSEMKLKKIKISEANTENKPSQNNENSLVDPRTFQPSNEGEVAAWEAWNQLEHTNLMAFKVTYLTALSKGLPAENFYQFVSEIKQDNTIKNPGAVFNNKVQTYLEGKEDRS